MKLFNLQKYAFTKNFFEEREPTKAKANANSTKNNDEKQEKTVTQQSKNPSQLSLSSLFWAFFCVFKGEDEYHLNQNNLFKIKNEFSMKSVETLKKEKVFMKQYKIRFHDVEASLLYDKDINLATLRALALYYNVNLLLIINNRYYLIENDTINDSKELHLIQKNRYKITFEKINRNDIGQKTVGKLYMEGTRDTLKAPGSYKLDEIKEICNKLGVNTQTKDGKKKTKQQLYDDIIIKID